MCDRKSGASKLNTGSLETCAPGDRFHLAARGDNDGLWDWDVTGNRIRFSPRWIAMMGCEEQELGNAPEEWFQRIHPEDRAQVLAQVESHLTGGPHQFEIQHRMRHRNGSYRWMSCRGMVLEDGNGGGRAARMVGAHCDITAQKFADPLTGLPNRMLLMDRLADTIESAGRGSGGLFALLLLDLEFPGAIQGDAGSMDGGRFATSAARHLETCLRANPTLSLEGRDYLAVRLDHEIFSVLLTGLNGAGEAKEVADRLLVEMSEASPPGGGKEPPTPSIGIAIGETRYHHPEEVLRDAEIALHRAKALGKSCSEVFDPAVLDTARNPDCSPTDLLEAIRQQQFKLVYQPIVSLESGRIAGFEALVRWHHPDRGVIMPDTFIPMAERTGIIVPLGGWVLREACLQLKCWQEDPLIPRDLWISVNVSAGQFTQRSMVQQIAEALRDTGLEPHCLMLELTESTLMENPAVAASMLMQLRVMGARIGLDDFGTGHSSLAYLRQFPADFLKIDRYFIRGVEIGGDRVEIVRTIAGLAAQLGLQVVAEGIENLEQLRLIRSSGCGYAQGYLLSKPVDSSKALEMLNRGIPLLTERNSEPDPATAIQPNGNDQVSFCDSLSTQERGEIADHNSARDGNAEGKHVRRSRALYLIPAILVLLAAVGLVVRFDGEAAPPSADPLQVDLQNSASAPQPEVKKGKPGEHMGSPDSKPSMPDQASRNMGASNAAPLRTAPESQSRSMSSASNAVESPGVIAPAPKNRARASSRIPDPPLSAQREYSYPVVHQHVLGGCRGILVVSAQGISFVPEKGKDAFALKFFEFLGILSDDTLSIKSDARTYKFKAADAADKTENQTRLKKIMDAITSLRPLPESQKR